MSGGPRPCAKTARGARAKRLARVFAAAAVMVFALCLALYARLASMRPAPAAGHAYFAGERTGAQVIAHRGGAGLWPENTLYAMERAHAAGADVLEMDVRLTSDGEFVLMHDATVARTTDGEGAVSALTLAELKRLDAGYRWTDDGGRTFRYRGLGITVPTLAEVLDSLPSARLVVEPKSHGPGTGVRLCGLLRARGAADRVIVASFRRATIEEFRGACPEVATSASFPEALRFFAMQRLGVARAFGPAMQALQIPEYFVGMRVPTRSFVGAARERNLKVHTWTVNDPADMRRLVEAGVDGVMTDYPDLLMKVLGRRKKE